MVKGSKEHYQQQVVAELMKAFSAKSPMAVPRLKHITLNMGLGAAKENKNIITEGLKALGSVAGQKAVPTLSKKDIAQFKIRKDLAIGAMVTLRKERMWSFMGRLVNVYLPRVKDFKGLSKKAFDAQGNYSIGINDARVFPELGAQATVKGMSVTLVIRSDSSEKSQKMLELMGLPFRK
ncbi:MAG: 50S ribosomal protein L5 [Spirochaetes bacterium]|nr:50S ribosomal protein L5 [Spirochaetota bacterium]